ncbi:MAG: 3-deoxy-7-phosphoheptulonate synthase, partial [Planctomycetota bacterium]|nr:3-deoxy-7-phosphoheptulonate synthase [Planctomycetota bacterium]
MIVVLKPLCSQTTIERLTRRIEELGMKPHIIIGVERTVIAATGPEREGMQAELEADQEVERVMPILAPYKIASRETRKDPTVITVGSLTIGGGTIGVIAGPCSVEGEESIIEIAKIVKAAGATALRGGAFKPRTSPYAFQGMKEKGLEFLAAAREVTGLAIVTEVMTPHHVELVAKYSDVLQIGAR